MASILNRLKFCLRSVIYGTLITGCALYGVIASILLRIVGKQRYAQYTVARAFYYTFSIATGIKIVVKNEKYLKQIPAVVVSNHQSALDILVLGRLFQPGYTVTSKKALQYVPFLGWFMLASGTFFLDRSKTTKAKEVLDLALAELKQQKGALFIFPEGTRSCSKQLTMLPFKKGAFHLAKQAKIPIIPVVVSNYSNIFHSQDKIFNSGTITLEVLEPISTKGLETHDDVSRFANDVREKMLEKLQKLGYSKTGSCSPPKPVATELVVGESDDIQETSEVSEADETLESEPLLSKATSETVG